MGKSIVVRGAGGGGKGGGSSQQRTPIEAPNTLQSNSAARIVDLISEGEIEGLVGGLKGIYFDNTPLQNPDGSFNFQNVIVDGRAGLPDQDPMSGFPAVETEVAVNAAVTALIPVTRAVINTAATAVRVTLQLAALVHIDVTTGDRLPTAVSIAIDVQASGGAFATIVSDTISGKTNSTYLRAYRLPLSGTGPWNVRVRRLSPDSTSDTQVDATTWASYTEIEDYQFSYPNSALVAIAVDAKNFGNAIPGRTYDIKGIRLQIPSNYNPITRVYTGIWDGTFQTKWSDNPAWVFYDLVTNTRYGLGQYIAPASVDKYGLYAIAQYCDGLVPDGMGGQEPRYTFNGVIGANGSAAPALQVLVTLASVFRGMVYSGAAGVTAVSDMPVDDAKLVTPANVIDGLITYAGSALKARHNFAHVSWYNPAIGYKQDIEPVEGDPDEIARWGLRTIEVVAFGCTSRGQAHRFGRWLLDSEKNETETATWTASWDHADVVPGEIVKIADPAYSGVEFGGRAAAIAVDAKSITLDRAVTLGAGKTYTLSIVLADGSLADRVVTTGPSTATVLSFDLALSPAPIVNAIWVLASTDVEPRRFRVISRVETDKHLFVITALLHDPTKYARVEQNITLTPPSYTALPSGTLAAPTNIATAESITLAGGSVARAKCTVSWTAAVDSRVVRYEVQQRPYGQDWERSGFSDGVAIDLFDLKSGRYGFRVRSMDGLGRVSAWLALADVTLLGLLLPPDDVDNVRADNYVDSNISISWDEISDYRPIRYALRKGSSWDAGLEIGTVAHPPFAAHGNATYWVKAYTGPDSGRVYSTTAASIVIAGVALARNVIASFDDAASGWIGSFSGTAAVSGGSIRTGGSSNILTESDFLNIADILNLGAQGNGAFQATQIIDAGRIAPCRVVFTWNGTASQVGQDILTNPDILNTPDFLGSSGSDFIKVYPELSLSQTHINDVYALDPVHNPANDVYAEADIYSADASFAPWIKYEPGVYTFRRIRRRLVLETTNAQTIAVGLAFSGSIDVPDRRDSWGLVAGIGASLTGVTVPPGGLAIVFATNESTVAEAFNGGNGSDLLPHVQITNGNGQTYDFTFDDLSLTGMTLYAKQAGIAVSAPKTNVTIEGY